MSRQRRVTGEAPDQSLRLPPGEQARHRNERPPFGFHALRPLIIRDFRYLWLGQVSNSLGLWMEMVARPLLVLQLTDNPVHLGLVLTARTIPQLFIGLFAGTFADRYNRRLILIFSKSGASLTTLFLAYVILTGEIQLWHVYITAALKSFFNAFDQPARNALIPTLVPRDQVLSAVAFNSSSMAGMRIGGAALAGVLVATVDTGYTFLVAGLLIALAVLFSILLRLPVRARLERGNLSLASDFFQGIKYVWQAPFIRSLLLMAMTWFLFGQSYMQVFVPLLAKDVMNIGGSGYGYLISTAGAGSLVGGLYIASRESMGKRGRVLPLIMAAFGALLVLFALSATLPWLLVPFALIALVGACQTVFMSLTNSALMQLARDEMRGRVFGVNSMDRAVTSGGAAMAGFLAAGVGAQAAQVVFGALIISLAVAWVLFGRSLRGVD